MSARYTGGLVYNAPGGWSGFFDGAGDYLSVASNAANALGSGDFTIQFWFNLSGTTGIGSSGEIGFIGCGIVTASRYTVRLQGTSTRVLSWWLNTPSNNVTGTTPIALNTWYHIAWVRSGSGSNNVKLYLNGILESQGTSTYNSPADTILIGRTYTNLDGEYTNGYLSNMQIVVGTALYTGNFTPPVGALAPVTNTALLTCRYPTFVDGSTNNFTITVNGSTTTSTVNPFPTSQLPNPALGNAGNGVYTMSQYAALKAANLWPAYDPYYKNVTLNLHGNAGAVLPFNTDASTNNFQVTQVGDTRPSNYTPFTGAGYYSNYFSATGSYLSVPYSSDFNLTGDFTIEFWMNPTNLPTSTGSAAQSYCRLFSFGTYNAANSFGLEINSNDSGNIRKLISWYNATSYGLSTNNAVTTNSWQHIALVRSGTTITCYINGTSTGLTITGASAAVNTSQSFYIATLQGFEANSSAQYAGYLSNFSILKGTAKYTSNFTPTTSPLSTSATNQTLLTCYGNRFYDANTTTTAKTITATGSPSVDPLQPFTAPTGTSAYGSGYFDGSGDYLSVADNTALEFGSGDFTVEMWAYYSSTSGTPVLIDKRANTGGYSPFIFYTTGGVVVFYSSSNGSSYDIANGVTIGTIIPNQWNHVAASRSGTSIRLFLNGVLGNTVTSSSALVNNSDAWTLGATPGGNSFNGYLSNARLVKGTAVYTSAFTPPTTPLTAITNTSLLTVQTNAPSQNNTFLDSSTNNFVITRNGNTTQGTFTPYGSNWSNYFDGSSHLTTAASASLQAGTGAFTLEGWVNITGSTSGSVLSQVPDVAGGYGMGLVYQSGTNLVYATITTTSTGAWNASFTPTKNVWYHLAFVRDASTNIAFFVNGVKITPTTGGSTNTTNITAFNYFASGAYFPDNLTRASFRLTGYVSNARFVKGSAVYDPTAASITVPTSQLTAVTNTQLLILQANRIYDGSSNAFAITYSGTQNIGCFSPFAPQAYYQPSVIGGSGYFDGSGDYLSAPNNVAFNLNSVSFTVECWVYWNSLSGEQNIVEQFTPASGPGWTLYKFNAGTIDFYGGTGSINSGVTPVAGQWYHLAISRDNSTGTTSFYVNGVRTATATFGVASTSATELLVGVRKSGSTWFNGYMEDLRIVKGSYVYNPTATTITVPTAPLTAITNTQLLLSYTNAGILDNAMMSDLETAGSAQISTSVKKYGTGSMYFDGSTGNLVGQYNQIYSFGTGDFTVEGWFYFTDLNTTQRGLVALGDGANGSGPIYNAWSLVYLGTEGSNQVRFYRYDGTEYSYTTSGLTLVANTWNHIAVCRASGTLRIFVNGVSYYSATVSQSFAAVNTNPLRVALQYYGPASGYNGPRYWPGYIDDLRITKVARYTANFTPPTSQLQDQ